MKRGHLILVPDPSPPDRTGPLRVLLADNHPRVRQRLAALFSAAGGFEVAQDIVDGTSIREQVGRWRPDILFLAVHLDSRSELDLLSRLHDDIPWVPIVILTMQRSSALVQRALEKGASGVVRKDHADSELIAAAHAIATGNPYVSPTISG